MAEGQPRVFSRLLTLLGILFEFRDSLDSSRSQLGRLTRDRNLAGAFDVRNAAIQRLHELPQLSDQDKVIAGM